MGPSCRPHVADAGRCRRASCLRCRANPNCSNPRRRLKRSSNLWWLSEIEAAVPTIFAATQEKFVPQMINFEVLGGVDFKKGCYPGQEIVARSQYLGKLKRRMNIAHVDATDVEAAADIYHSGAAQPIGTVVMAAAVACRRQRVVVRGADRSARIGLAASAKRRRPAADGASATVCAVRSDGVSR